MERYIKYEIKGSYKFILGIIAMVLIASTVIMFNTKGMTITDENNLVKVFLLVGPMMIIFGAFLTAFFYIIGSFRKELYEDRGFLTFSLPLSGGQILGSKLIVAILWFLLLGVSMVVYTGFLGMVLYEKDWVPILKDILEFLSDSNVWAFLIISGISAVTTLIMIYFCIALSRVTIKNKKIGGFWFVLFLIMNSLYGFISATINKILPCYMDFSKWRFVAHGEMIALSGGKLNTFLPFVPGDMAGSLYYSVTLLVLTILVGVGMFYGTSYIIENKIDI